MDYNQFLESKRKTFIESGFEIDESELNPMMKDFQLFGVKTALFKGRFAFFFDCGLGKTFSQLDWAKQVSLKTKKPVIILAPLAIVEQTISEGLKFGYGRDGNDEKHICPLQLDTIERILHLYSNEGETVFSPFGGIGSEGCCAIKMDRKSISIELKESYFKINESNHKAFVEEKNSTLTLF